MFDLAGGEKFRRTRCHGQTKRYMYQGRQIRMFGADPIMGQIMTDTGRFHDCRRALTRPSLGSFSWPPTEAGRRGSHRGRACWCRCQRPGDAQEGSPTTMLNSSICRFRTARTPTWLATPAACVACCTLHKRQPWQRQAVAGGIRRGVRLRRRLADNL